MLFLFGAAALAAFGTDLLMKFNMDLLKRFTVIARRVVLAAFGFAIAAVIVSLASRLTGFAVETTERGKLAFIRRAAAMLSPQFTPPHLSIIMPLVFLSTALFLVWMLAKRRLGARGFIGCAVAAIGIGTCRFLESTGTLVHIRERTICPKVRW